MSNVSIGIIEVCEASSIAQSSEGFIPWQLCRTIELLSFQTKLNKPSAEPSNKCRYKSKPARRSIFQKQAHSRLRAPIVVLRGIILYA
ncbi:hypothetical protein Naga_100208g11 [Nannochloropsis gaditana]|uniref:Uncharacterized protein n=1 Tax=Nannochloropsis gaditana TaxID=72520 RepID=W7TFS1_9STRA|nr:hypothetical protein Naga_100208g11 [Nannochloropsis gaditana]